MQVNISIEYDRGNALQMASFTNMDEAMEFLAAESMEKDVMEFFAKRRANGKMVVSSKVPEKRRYAFGYTFVPENEDDIIEFYSRFKGKISDDLFEPNTKAVAELNIKMLLK